MNPERARLVVPEQALATFVWSSYPLYLQALSRRPDWLRACLPKSRRRQVDRLLGEWGIPQDRVAGRREFEVRMEARRAGERDGKFKAVRRGWRLGGEEFRRELLAQVAEKRGGWHYGAELVASDEAQAERLIEVELQRKGWTVADLQARRKDDPFKVRLAAKLRTQTTVTAVWIAERLSMGTWTNVANCLAKGNKIVESWD